MISKLKSYGSDRQNSSTQLLTPDSHDCCKDDSGVVVKDVGDLRVVAALRQAEVVAATVAVGTHDLIADAVLVTDVLAATRRRDVTS